MGKRGPKPTFCRICGAPCFGHGLCNKHYTRWRTHGDPMRVDKPHGEAKRFLMEAAEHRGKKCLPWPYAVVKGYGYVHFKGQMMRASRAVCLLTHGPARGREAAHECGNSVCVNPRHIYWATSKQNKADAVRHGTAWWL